MADNEGRTSFRQLQARLPELWTSIEEGSGVHTSVVVPSLSFSREELAKIAGAPFYEERLLFSLIRLRDPRARVLYVTSQPLHPHIVDYYLQLLVGVPASHARARLGLLCAYDGSDRPLSEKILERPRLIERIRQWVGNLGRAYLTCFSTSGLERDLALALGIPLNGADPDHLWMGTKSGSRRVLAEAGVECPLGEEVRSEEDLIAALERLAERQPGLARAVVKLDQSFAGAGNAVFRYPHPLPGEPSARRAALQGALGRLAWTVTSETWPGYRRKLLAMGGVVEELVEGGEVRSPSVQMRINPNGEPSIISTHDQVLGGATGQTYQGCRFPASSEYRRLIQSEASKIAAVLARRGVVSRFGVDFLVIRAADGEWRSLGIEINLRMGGTTPPFLALQFLTGGEVEEESGRFLSPSGQRKCYYATDTLSSPSYRGLLPEDLIDILTRHGLHFRPSTETGVLFHMIGALSQYGKVGVTCIGNSPDEASELFERTVRMLDAETAEGVGAPPAPEAADVASME